MRKSEAAKAVQQSRRMGTAGQAYTRDAIYMTTGTNRVVLGPRGKECVLPDRGGKEEEMANLE